MSFPFCVSFPFYVVFPFCYVVFSFCMGFPSTDGQMNRLKDGSMEEQIEPLIERQNKFEIL